MSKITTMGIENDNGSPTGDLSDSEKEQFDEILSFVNESIHKINRHIQENVNLLTVKVDEDMQKAAEEQKSEEELMLIQDEYLRKVTSLAINGNNMIVDLVVDIGIFTREEVLEKAGEIEGIEEVERLEDYPKAFWIIAHKQDEDDWLANWLPQNPGFFENVLSGEWPEWLSPPPSDLDE